MPEHTFTGRITGLVIFSVLEFGIRARFKVEDTGRSPVVCAVEAMLRENSSPITARATRSQ
jgi:hypothetical protein